MKSVYLLLLCVWLISCRKSDPINSEPDNATLLSGEYDLIRATSGDRDILSFYKAWLSISKIDANTVKADFSFSPPISPLSNTWTLQKLAQDTIAIKGYDANLYQNG